MTEPKKEPAAADDGVVEAREVLLTWIKERVKDAEILAQEIVVGLFTPNDRPDPPERLIFSERLDPKKTDLVVFVNDILDQALEDCERAPGHHKFAVRVRGDSRSKRFSLYTKNVASERFEGCTPEALARVAQEIEREGIEEEDRKVWVRFAAAAVSNTAQFTKPPTEADKPKKPGTSRSFNTIAPDVVSGYAVRVADEMLRAFRARWKR